jgi:hypothetical protein
MARPPLSSNRACPTGRSGRGRGERSAKWRPRPDWTATGLDRNPTGPHRVRTASGMGGPQRAQAVTDGKPESQVRARPPLRPRTAKQPRGGFESHLRLTAAGPHGPLPTRQGYDPGRASPIARAGDHHRLASASFVLAGHALHVAYRGPRWAANDRHRPSVADNSGKQTPRSEDMPADRRRSEDRPSGSLKAPVGQRLTIKTQLHLRVQPERDFSSW